SFMSSGRSTNLLLNLFLIRSKSKLLVPVVILTNVWFIKGRHQISFLLSSSYVPVLNSISALVLSFALLIISICSTLPIKRTISKTCVLLAQLGKSQTVIFSLFSSRDGLSFFFLLIRTSSNSSSACFCLLFLSLISCIDVPSTLTLIFPFPLQQSLLGTQILLSTEESESAGRISSSDSSVESIK